VTEDASTNTAALSRLDGVIAKQPPTDITKMKTLSIEISQKKDGSFFALILGEGRQGKGETALIAIAEALKDT
jgi:hypothetical protein